MSIKSLLEPFKWAIYNRHNKYVGYVVKDNTNYNAFKINDSLLVQRKSLHEAAVSIILSQG